MVTLKSFRIFLLWVLTLSLTLLFFTSSSTAQVLSDGDVGNPNVNSTLGTIVNTVGDTSKISGGTRPGGGQNLFHSFSQFDVPGGHTALFQNSVDNPATANIFGRITNGNPSNIFGTVDSATNFPTASLWLMNPAGFLFGPNATLDVAGTFAAVTANSLNFEDGTKFPSAPNTTTDGLLNVSNVVAMEFMGTDTPVMAAGSEAAIEVQGLDSQGADVLLVGRGAQSGLGGPFVPGVLINGEMKTNGGDFTIGSRNAAGIVGVNAFGPGEVNELGGTILINRNDSNHTSGKVNVVHATNPSVGGRIVIRSGQFLMDGSNTELKASVANSLEPAIDLKARKSITIIDGRVTTETQTTSPGGEINLEAGNDIGLSNTQVLASTTDIGDAGPVSLSATNVTLENNSLVGGTTTGSGDAPKVNVDVDTLSITSVSAIGNLSSGTGGVGEVSVQADTSIFISGFNFIPDINGILRLVPSGIFSTAEGTGGAGLITVNTGSLQMDHLSQINGIAGFNGAHASNILVQADTLTLKNGAQIISSSYGAGQTGNITVMAEDLLSISGFNFVPGMNGNFQLQLSGLFSNAFNVGGSGTISINTSSLEMDNGGQIGGSVGQFGLNAADISVVADTVRLATGAQINSGSIGAGQTGNITVMAEDLLSISGFNTGLFSNAFSVGGSGTITINASSLEMDNGGQIGGSVGQFGLNAADISVVADTIRLDTGAQINSSSLGPGRAGNLLVAATESISISGSILTVGNSGNLEIQASGIVSDAFGFTTAGNAGTITLSAPKVKLDSGGKIEGDTLGVGKGAEILVVTDELQLNNFSAIRSNSLATGNSGNVSIEGFSEAYVKETKLSNDSVITTVSEAFGKAGDVTLNSELVTLENGAQIVTATTGEGDGGNIKISAKEIAISGIGVLGFGSGFIASSESPVATANAGTVSLEATDSVTLSEGGAISGTSRGAGRAGDVNVITGVLTLEGGSQINSSTTAQGNAGNVMIKASESVLVSGVLETNKPINENSGIFLGQRSGIFSNSLAFDTGGNPILDPGDAGSVAITTPGSIIVNTGNLSVSTAGGGTAGNLTVSGGQDITINDAVVGALSLADGDAGNISIHAGNTMTIQNTTITSESKGTGQGGTITLNADGENTVNLNSSTITALVNNFDKSNMEDGADKGLANISVTSPTINIDGSTITTQSRGDRNAGGVAINATNTLNLRGNSTVSATADIAQAGDLSLDAINLLFIQDSNVTSSVQGGPGTEGGDISIGVNSNPGFLIIQRSSITTTALFGDGGDVNFTGQVRLIDPFTTIDVSSQFGTSGTVNESGPIQNLSGAIAPLPEEIVDLATLVGQHCAAQKGGQLSSFVEAGRDVVPPGPADFLTSPLFLNLPQSSNIQDADKRVGTLAAQRLGMGLGGEIQIAHIIKVTDSRATTRCLL